jgi:hypothetical protein
MTDPALKPTPKMDAVRKLANSPFKAYRETVTDGRTGLISAAKNAFSGSFYVASAIMLWLTFGGKLTEAYFGLYLGTYALTKLGDKAVEHAASVLGGKPPPGEAPPPKSAATDDASGA